MLLLWLRQIGINFDAHYREATHLGIVDSRYVTGVSLFAGFAAIGSLINIAEWGEGWEWLDVTLKIIAAVASCIVIFMNQMRDRHKFEENSTRNRQAAEQYDDLSAYIQVATLKDEKPEPGIFLSTIMDRFRFIKQFGPDLPDGFASIASLPNLILMKDAQKRNGQQNETKIQKANTEDLNKILEEDDKKLFSGSDTSDSYPLREVVIESEHNDNIIPLTPTEEESFQETLRALPVEMDRVSNDINEDKSADDSMEIIDSMGLCSPEKNSIRPARPARPARPPQYIGPEPASPRKLIKHMKRRKSVRGDVRKTLGKTMKSFVEEPTPKERLDTAMERKMAMLKLRNNAY
tara:strand:- start:257 stop:1303 length:1047 start_codon:yes stop_codon:yes gene_type:complete